MAQNRSTVAINVGVVFDMDAWVGKMGLSCISMALSDFYSSDHGSDYKTRLVLHTRDSKRDVVAAAAAGKLFIYTNIHIPLQENSFFPTTKIVGKVPISTTKSVGEWYLGKTFPTTEI